jgi:hypothetical protein
LIHQGLQRQRALVAPGGGDQSLLDVHRFFDRGRTALPCQQEERGQSVSQEGSVGGLGPIVSKSVPCLDRNRSEG